MSANVVCFFVLVSTLLQKGHTFWWQSSTPKSSDNVLRQIPLTYFRTYTYQPLAANPFAYQFLAGNTGDLPPQPFAPQSPLLRGYRYDGQLNQQAATREPPTTSTTTTSTTTTTTTPAPTTTASTTTAAPAPTTENVREDWPETGGRDYPAYNRRFYSSALSPMKTNRPSYPYPEYSAFQPSSSKLDGMMTPGRRSTPQIQFVPCMCPINLGISAELGSKAGFRDPFLAEARTAASTDMDLPHDQEITDLSMGKDEGEPSGFADKSAAEELRRTEEAQLMNTFNMESIEKREDDQRTHAELL